MSESLSAQLDASLAQLNALIRRGREIGGALAVDPSSAVVQAGARIWQHDCATTVSQLSGGSKAHWLSRAYSDALLVRSAGGGAMVDAPVTDIVGRVLGVLDQAVASLSQPGAAAAAAEPPLTHRFDFVRDEALRPILEEAFRDSGRALDEGDYERSLMTSCSILEAIITDALAAMAPLPASARRASARSRRSSPTDSASEGGKGRPTYALDAANTAEPDPGYVGHYPGYVGHRFSGAGAFADMSFDERITTAERANLIRSGCARLPAVARAYRDPNDSGRVVTAHDAKITRQVMHVVMRDLDPGR